MKEGDIVKVEKDKIIIANKKGIENFSNNNDIIYKIFLADCKKELDILSKIKDQIIELKISKIIYLKKDIMGIVGEIINNGGVIKVDKSAILY